MSKNEFETICSIPTEFVLLDTGHMSISALTTRRLNPKRVLAVDWKHLK
jgi:hypothetical protein